MAPSLRSVIGLLALGPLVSGQGCPFAGAEKRDVLPGRGAEEPSLTTLADSFGKCPTLSDAAGGGTRSKDWWPCQLSLDVLRQFSPEQNPLGGSFDYAAAFAKLDCKLLAEFLHERGQLILHRCGAQEKYPGCAKDLTTLVACGLWQLWAFLHSVDLA